MFHKIKNVTPLKDFKLSIQFAEGITKIYDMKKLIENNKIFAELKDINLFNSVEVDIGGYGIIWNDNIDISCDELFENSKKIDMQQIYGG